MDTMDSGSRVAQVFISKEVRARPLVESGEKCDSKQLQGVRLFHVCDL